jgi:glycosyltransferase involved in cell wall biosynthesis
MASNGARVSLAYLIGHYPGVSLTFTLREVRLLRSLGFDIHTASVNPPQPSGDGFTQAEEEEYQRTFYVKGSGWPRVITDHVACFVNRPIQYLVGLLFAIRLGRTDLREILFHLFYFAEAVIVGRWMAKHGLEHVHVYFYGVEQFRLREKLADAAFVICIGQFCRSQLMNVSQPDQWSKFHVVRLGVDPELFLPQPRHRSTTETNIVSVGRLSPEKGHSILLSAIAELQRRGIRTHLHLVGDGPCGPELRNAAAELGVPDAITFHGSVNQDRLRDVLRIADLFVLPSFAEGIPVSLMEAMSMEIPCISTYVGGIPELIDSGVDGVLVPPSDPGLLAEEMYRLVADSNRRRTIGRAGRQKVIDHFNLEANVKLLSEVLSQQLGKTFASPPRSVFPTIPSMADRARTRQYS